MLVIPSILYSQVLTNLFYKIHLWNLCTLSSDEWFELHNQRNSLFCLTSISFRSQRPVSKHLLFFCFSSLYSHFSPQDPQAQFGPMLLKNCMSAPGPVGGTTAGQMGQMGQMNQMNQMGQMGQLPGQRSNQMQGQMGMNPIGAERMPMGPDQVGHIQETHIYEDMSACSGLRSNSWPSDLCTTSKSSCLLLDH